MEMQDRYQRGWEKLRETDEKAGDRIVENLKDIAPDFARYIIEFAFGDIFSRPGLDLKSREIAVVAALTALGNAAPQLKYHIDAALNVGCSRQEVIEIIMQMAFLRLLTGSPQRGKCLKSAIPRRVAWFSPLFHRTGSYEPVNSNART